MVSHLATVFIQTVCSLLNKNKSSTLNCAKIETSYLWFCSVPGLINFYVSFFWLPWSLFCFVDFFFSFQVNNGNCISVQKEVGKLYKWKTDTQWIGNRFLNCFNEPFSQVKFIWCLSNHLIQLTKVQ